MRLKVCELIQFEMEKPPYKGLETVSIFLLERVLYTIIKEQDCEVGDWVLIYFDEMLKVAVRCFDFQQYMKHDS